jgi:hypothetical protein
VIPRIWNHPHKRIDAKARIGDSTRKAERLLAQMRRELEAMLKRDAPKVRG